MRATGPRCGAIALWRGTRPDDASPEAHTRASGVDTSAAASGIGGAGRRAGADRPRPAAALDPRLRPLRKRAGAGRQHRDRDLHRRRRHQADRRRAGAAVRHGRHRLRRDERERPGLRGRRADRDGRLHRRRAGRPATCWPRSARACGPAPSRPGSRSPAASSRRCPRCSQGHPSPHGVDLVGAAIGVVPRDRILTGERDRAGRRRDRRALERLALERLHARAAGAARRGRPVARRRRLPSSGRTAGRGAARAHGDLRSRGARPAALGGGGATGLRTSPATDC